jgi:site-specific DNA-methyltransferase (adenine-specific)
VIDMANISDLRFDDKNFNDHSEYGMSLLEKSLQEFGAGRSILIDKNNNIIAGNGVIEAAGNIGLEDMQIVETTGDKIVAVKRTDIELNSKKGRGLAMADNAVNEANLTWNKGNIEEVSEQFDIDPGEWISDWNQSEDTEVEEDEAPEVNESEPAKSELGKVYQLGRHRLMCGDSTDAGSVAILMDGQKADMVFTDPPYNVAIGDKNKALNALTGSKSIERNLEGDVFKTDEEAGEKLWLPAFKNMLDNAEDVCSIYVTMPQGGTHMMMMMMMDKAGWQVKHELIWMKNSPTFSMGRLDYDYQHEPICFGWNKGHKKIGKGKFTKSIWEIDKPRKDGDHPTMKPIELVVNALQNSSEVDDDILDLFGGSGSTLIACEQLGRKCYMMELDPKYCDVIRKRYWKFTHDGNEEGWEEGTPAI